MIQQFWSVTIVFSIEQDRTTVIASFNLAASLPQSDIPGFHWGFTPLNQLSFQRISERYHASPQFEFLGQTNRGPPGLFVIVPAIALNRMHI
jgi:hypothetical protein